ncbi:MAG: LysR family transcriptional regulator [Oscillibacter sp.]|jgi:DNA-binding transcriptional LysR family regulator|nr:LysR family transcriptional regulator [Oscillibacter sp.]
MDTQKIKVLLSAVEAGSFLRAADALGYTPSGITHMMDALEALSYWSGAASAFG